MKYGYVNRSDGRQKSIIQTKIDSVSLGTVVPVAPKVFNTAREIVKPETAWARARFNLNIL